MKRFITLFMALLLCFGFVSCANESSSGEDDWVKLDSSNMFDYVSGSYSREYPKTTTGGTTYIVKETYSISALGGMNLITIDVLELSKNEAFPSFLEEMKAKAEENDDTLVYDETKKVITINRELDILTIYLLFALCNGESNKAKTKFKITNPSTGEVAIYTKR